MDRRAARVLLLDGAGRILLFSARKPDGARPERLWFAPGGGLEPGERWEDAARRELREETGLDVALGRCVWLREHVWYFAARDVWVRSIERYFVARTAATAISVDGWSALERQLVDRWRWWTLAELAATGDELTPRRLATLLLPIVAGELPPAPFDVGE